MSSLQSNKHCSSPGTGLQYFILFMMFYKKTYTKKESSVKHYKKTDSSNDLLEDLGDTIDRVRRYV